MLRAQLQEKSEKLSGVFSLFKLIYFTKAENLDGIYEICILECMYVFEMERKLGDLYSVHDRVRFSVYESVKLFILDKIACKYD